MAGFVDVCSLILTSAFFIGVILGTALIAQKCQTLIDATKASLEERGWMVSGTGATHSSSSSSREGGGGGKGSASASVVVVKTRTGKKKMDHERYLDATQRGIIKALNASTFGVPSSQSQTTANASAAGPSSSVLSSASSSSFGGLGLGSTFTHFRSQLLLPPSVGPQPQPQSRPQPDQLVESAGSGRGVGGGPAVGGGATQASGASATSDDAGTRDSLYDMADRFSAWPSEKIEKAKRLRDQFLSSKV